MLITGTRHIERRNRMLMENRWNHAWRVAAALALLSCVAGCAAPRGTGAPSLSAVERDEIAGGPTIEPYVLQVGDLVDIKFFYNPGLNESVRIRPDGRISLQLADEVDAFGLTPAQLDQILTDLYAHVLQDPEVTVIVREFAGQHVYIGGEVMSPAIMPLNPNMTALEAIIGAGGLRETAEPRSVIIISRSPENTREVRRVDLSGLLAGRPAADELYLRPFDVVHVPKTFIAEANKFVDQYINRLIPSRISAGFSYSIYRGTQTGSIDSTPLR